MDYEVGSIVNWIDREGAYEGVIEGLYNNSVRVKNIKKLYPPGHMIRLPYWKLSEGYYSNEEKGNVLMSTKANIIFRNEMNIKRETVLYQHSDAHPNNMALVIAERLRDAYQEFKELGDIDWFLSPSKLASFMLVKSVPVATDEMKSLLKTLPESTRYQLESTYFLGMPTMLIEPYRVSNCNYDYIITLSENVEDGEEFFGYELEINKMSNNKIVSNVMKHRENLLKDIQRKKVKVKEKES